MKENGFKLEQILKYRMEIERVRTQEFVAARYRVDQANELLRQEQVALADFKRQYNDNQMSLQDIDEISLYANYLIRKQNEVEQRKQQVVELQGILAEKRANLLEATKDRKVLESLKEKKIREFRQLMDQKAQEFMDEISVQKKGAAH